MQAPSRKWLAAFVTGAATIATMTVEAGGWHVAETIALIGFLTARALAYLLSNDEGVTS